MIDPRVIEATLLLVAVWVLVTELVRLTLLRGGI